VREPAWTIEDIEPGDRFLAVDRDGIESLTITVRLIFKTTNHGWVIETEEYLNGFKGLYLDDGWKLTWLKPGGPDA